jgi:enamine deaminase RidA (YjgF/YER057c/UK114 family)
MPARFARADGLYQETGYAYTAIAGRGSLIFAAGACPIDEDGKVAGGADYVAQARHTVANLRIALAAAGASLADVLKTTVYVIAAEKADLVAVWDVVHEAFGDIEPPSTLLGVSMLGYPGQLVEIEAIAQLPAPDTASSGQ